MANNKKAPELTSGRSVVIELDILRSTGVFELKGGFAPFFIPCIIFALISVNDLLGLANATGSRVTSKIDVPDGFDDLTHLINDARNAACHVRSPKRKAEANVIANAIIDPWKQGGLTINGVTLASEYEDDIAIFWGQIRLYVRRNLLFAFDECRELITPDRVANDLISRLK